MHVERVFVLHVLHVLHTQREVEWRKSKEGLDQSQKLLYMTKRGVKEKETKITKRTKRNACCEHEKINDAMIPQATGSVFVPE